MGYGDRLHCFRSRPFVRFTPAEFFASRSEAQIQRFLLCRFEKLKASVKCFVVVMHGFLGCIFSAGLSHWLCRLRIEDFRWFCHVGRIRVLCFLGLAILWFRVQRRFPALRVCSDRERGLDSGCRLPNRGGWLDPLSVT